MLNLNKTSHRTKENCRLSNIYVMISAFSISCYIYKLIGLYMRSCLQYLIKLPFLVQSQLSYDMDGPLSLLRGQGSCYVARPFLLFLCISSFQKAVRNEPETVYIGVSSWNAKKWLWNGQSNFLRKLWYGCRTVSNRRSEMFHFRTTPDNCEAGRLIKLVSFLWPSSRHAPVL